MKGIVILEGANATGKSTLAKELEKRYGATVYHQTYRFKDRIFDYHTAVLRRAIERSKTSLVVLDRLWMSETAYAAVYRGGTRWPLQGRFMDRVLQRVKAVNMICIETDDTTLSERFKSTRSHRTDADVNANCQINKIYRSVVSCSDDDLCFRDDYMDCLAATPRHDIIPYTISGMSLDAVCDLLEAKLTKMDDGLTYDDNILGSLSDETKFVIVGDRLNAKHRWAWPFYEYGNCSLWLTRQLHALRFDEREAVWTNVNESSQQIEIIMSTGTKARVVALGLLARDRLRELGIKDVATMPHPQHGRRFAYDGREYRSRLRDALAGSSPLLSEDEILARRMNEAKS